MIRILKRAIPLTVVFAIPYGQLQAGAFIRTLTGAPKVIHVMGKVAQKPIKEQPIVESASSAIKKAKDVSRKNVTNIIEGDTTHAITRDIINALSGR